MSRNEKVLELCRAINQEKDFLRLQELILELNSILSANGKSAAITDEKPTLPSRKGDI